MREHSIRNTTEESLAHGGQPGPHVSLTGDSRAQTCAIRPAGDVRVGRLSLVAARSLSIDGHESARNVDLGRR